jgi:hypothetical protein
VCEIDKLSRENSVFISDHDHKSWTAVAMLPLVFSANKYDKLIRMNDEKVAGCMVKCTSNVRR